MAFRGILPEAPSFGTQLARGLGGGFGQGIASSADLAQKLSLQKAKSQDMAKLQASNQENEALKRLTGQDVSGLSGDLKREFFKNFMKPQQSSPEQQKAAQQAASFQQGLGTVAEMRGLVDDVSFGSGFSQIYSPKTRAARQKFDTLGTSLIGLYGSTLPSGIRNKAEFNKYMTGIATSGQTKSTMNGSLDALEMLFKTGMERNQLMSNPAMSLSPQGAQKMKEIEMMERDAIEQLKQSSKPGNKLTLKEIFK